jgi:hypothetical protein
MSLGVSLPDRMDLLKHDVLRGHPRKTYVEGKTEVQCIYTHIIISLKVPKIKKIMNMVFLLYALAVLTTALIGE